MLSKNSVVNGYIIALNIVLHALQLPSEQGLPT